MSVIEKYAMIQNHAYQCIPNKKVYEGIFIGFTSNLDIKMAVISLLQQK